MAIYYIDPHTTVNGTGTWASPWSLNSSIRTGLASGDEIRIKGIALSSLLLSTTYTASVTNVYQLTITAGGNLGTDWAVGDIAYIPASDIFAKIMAKTGNIISFTVGSTTILPLLNTSVTSLNLQKVDLTTYGFSGNSTSLNITGTGAVSNITVTDCWVDATTRVTDGSVKTLIHSSASASNNTTLSDNINANSLAVVNYNFDLSNTHVLNNNYITTTALAELQLNCSYSTFTLNQLNGRVTFGSGNLSPIYNTQCNIRVLYGLSGTYLGTTSYSRNCSLTINTVIVYTSDTGVPAGSLTYCYKFNKSIGTLVANSASAALLYGNYVISSADIIINNLDFYATPSMSLAICANTVGDLSLTVCPLDTDSFYKSKKTLKQTAFPSGYALNTSAAYNFGKLKIPAIFSYLPITAQYAPAAWPSSIATHFQEYKPTVCEIEFPTIPSQASLPYLGTNGVNLLFTGGDFAQAYESLSVSCGALNYGNGYANTSFPLVSTDTDTYRTVSPSLKSYLATRSSGIWVVGAAARKAIKIPAVAGTSYSISGYIRTNDTAYVNGDCKMVIALNNTLITSQEMTTACINAWEQFNLNFTASVTGEYLLVWVMYYENGAKSYWLDDLTIS